MNVTIDRDVALEYARTHSQNGGPIFASVLLVLFGLVMTLVWIYLALCACCCTLKRAATPRVSPRSPGTSPVSPSRSSAPLRGRGEKGSTRPYYNDDGGVEMGGGGGKTGTPRSPYALGRATSWEREGRRYSFRCLYVCSALSSAILLVCVLGVFASQSKFDGKTLFAFGVTWLPSSQPAPLHANNHPFIQARCGCWRARAGTLFLRRPTLSAHPPRYVPVSAALAVAVFVCFASVYVSLSLLRLNC